MNVTSHIKRLYKRWKNERNFSYNFNNEVVDFIVQESPKGTVNIEKLSYELKALPRRCKDRNLSTKWYLKQIVALTEACIAGHHGKVAFDQAEIVVNLQFDQCCGGYCSEAGCCSFG